MFCNSLNRVVFLDLCFQIRMPTLLLCDKLSQNVDFLRVAVAVLRDPWKSTVGKWGEQNSTLSPLYPPLLSPHAWVTLVLSHFSLCDPTGCSPPGSSVHGISQTRVLEWVAISSFRGSSWPRDQTHVSCTGRWILHHWLTWEALLLSPISPSAKWPSFSILYISLVYDKSVDQWFHALKTSVF